MENLQQMFINYWNIFVSSNLFNFVIFVGLFALIFKKFDIKGMLIGAQKKVAEVIDTAKREKQDAINTLDAAQNSVANLENELSGLIQDAETSAEVIGNKILSEAKKQIESIEANAIKIISAEEKLLVANLTKNTSKASVEVAKNHIKNVLEQTPTLHEKYINESIDELDRLIF